MDFPLREILAADLVVTVDQGGEVKWVSHRDRESVVDMLRQIADGIESEEF